MESEKIDWPALRRAATEVMARAYVPYSRFPVGAAALVDDGRIVSGCNVENASYGLTLCAECGVVSSLHATGGGRLVALSCVDGAGAVLMPCGRCRQLLYEHGGPNCLVDFEGGPVRVADLLPHAFGPEDLERRPDSDGGAVPERLRRWRGRGTVFVHPDSVGGRMVWTAYWERSSGFAEPQGSSGGEDEARTDEQRGILEEGGTWVEAEAAVAWGRARTPRVVVVDAEGGLAWAGEGTPPSEVSGRWQPGSER